MTKEKIKKAALDQFAQNGYEGARLADIAKAVNIKTASLYFHFESKEQLFIEIFDEVKVQKLHKLQCLSDEIHGLDSVKEQLYTVYQFFSTRDYQNNGEELFWKRCTLFPPAFYKNKIRQELIAYQRKFVEETLRPVITQGIRGGQLKAKNPEIGVAAFFGIIDALFNEIHYSREARYKEKVNLLWDFYWEALANDGGKENHRPSA